MFCFSVIYSVIWPVICIRTSLQIEPWRKIYWSDFLVTLGWIRGDPNRRKPFIQNQVKSIRRFSNTVETFPGFDNQDDFALRGAPAHTLVESKFWWHSLDIQLLILLRANHTVVTMLITDENQFIEQLYTQQLKQLYLNFNEKIQRASLSRIRRTRNEPNRDGKRNKCEAVKLN